MRSYPRFAAFPRLGAFPCSGLLQGVTPVQALPGTQAIWIRRDDLSAADYGGNKIRKLDLLLARAAADGTRDLVIFGYSGSNFVAATAWHGRRLGLRTHAFLLPQADAPYVADSHASCARLDRLAQRTLALLRRADPSAVPSRIAEVSVRTDFCGERYAVAGPQTKTALQRFEQASAARSNSAYSGKALACLYADVDAGMLDGPARYWHTFNAHGRPVGVAPLAPQRLRDFVVGAAPAQGP